MKRILILTKGLGRGGVEQLLLNAAGYFDRSRFEFQVAYLLPNKDALAGELRERGLRVSCLGMGRDPGWIFRLRDLARNSAVDLVHAHAPVPAVGARLALWRRRTPLVYTEHNEWPRYRASTYWANLLTYRRNDHVFTVSDQVQESVRYPGPLRVMKMPSLETLYHGPDPGAVNGWNEPDGVRDELGIPRDAVLIGTIANFKTHKGHRDLLAAADIVRKRAPEARFVLVGQGPREDEIRDRARSLGLNDTVAFTGYRPDAQRVASAFDIFLLASLHEGLSIALLEAMALGKPAIVTRVGGLPEVIEDRKQGLLTAPGDPRSLADAVLTLVADERLRTSMGEAARTRAADFDIRKAVKRMEAVYEEMLA